MPSCTPQRTSTLVFCQEIESNQQLRDQYCRRVRNIAKWYKATFERYNTILKTEIGMETLAKELGEISCCCYIKKWAANNLAKHSNFQGRSVDKW